jgi:hypothetical protein
MSACGHLADISIAANVRFAPEAVDQNLHFDEPKGRWSLTVVLNPNTAASSSGIIAQRDFPECLPFRASALEPVQPLRPGVAAAG